MSKAFCVYILASHPHGYLYVGVTSNLRRRIYEHQQGLVAGHSQKHRIKLLVYYEVFDDPITAIAREKQLKRYPRQHKFNLIERKNLHWHDLFSTIAC